MHDRNPYVQKPDFRTLAQKYPNLSPYIVTTKTGTPALDFTDPRAQRELTCALLWVDFGIRLEIPLDTLCPPVPNRLDYILMIEDLILESGKGDREVFGIDIGTGASCIYPLLACTRNKQWNMLALDIEPRSISYARANISRNGLEKRVKVVLNESSDTLLPAELLVSFKTQIYDFLLTNPPFYTSPSQIAASRSAKNLPPTAICTGALNEMITAGGELAFILKLVEESRELKGRVRWWSSLVGRKSDVGVLEGVLGGYSGEGCEWRVRSGRMARTVRWVVLW
ncbi:ribosomal RNA large subunit methyltransferase F-like protein, partial [Fimicolochytrium jonesii]|uniref:ribosomal RNA large subunit methyltransferase F-like protein n=1 Tax=Fimicolochytrium jonesii TaxID=1396493 RepID=UPI0022FE83F3